LGTQQSENQQETNSHQGTQLNEAHQIVYEEPFMQRHKNFFKGCMISILILTLLIPTHFIGNLITERQARNETVKAEIATQCGNMQTVCGPVLVIPYLQAEKNSEGKNITSRSFAFFMPESLKINAKQHAENKNNRTFKVPLYNASLHITGMFTPLNKKALNIPVENMLLNEATLFSVLAI
jgi:inner membrane protein